MNINDLYLKEKEKFKYACQEKLSLGKKNVVKDIYQISCFTNFNIKDLQKKFEEENANFDPKEGHSLYVGNCVITKKCVRAVYKFMGITDELEFMSSSVDNKHHIEFWIGRKAKCTFHEGRAKACCYTDIEDTIKVFFSYFYPEEYITIEK